LTWYKPDELAAIVEHQRRRARRDGAGKVEPRGPGRVDLREGSGDDGAAHPRKDLADDQIASMHVELGRAAFQHDVDLVMPGEAVALGKDGQVKPIGLGHRGIRKPTLRCVGIRNDARRGRLRERRRR